MDEKNTLSWRARLAKSNINILHIDDDRWYYEFMYHPKPGQTKWCKTYIDVAPYINSPKIMVKRLEEAVLSLRKELEA